MRRLNVVCARKRSQTLAQRRSSCAGCKRPARTPHRVWISTGCRKRELERLYAGLVKLASMDETLLRALVEQVMPGGEVVSSE